jgi:endonuclease/exonuclease/phosphatase family metal-dependent hydrolase
MGMKVVERRGPKNKRSPKRRERKHSFGSVLFTLLAAVAGCGLLLSYLALFFNPTQHPVPMFFGLYYIPILLLNLLLLLIALFRHPRTLLIPVIALLPTLLLADRFVKFGREEQQLEGSHIKVLSYNLGRYDAGGKRVTATESVSGIKRYLAEQNADVVCLQEFAVKDTTTLSVYLPDYPYRARHLFKGDRYFGNLTLSKYPIREVSSLTFPDSRNLSLVTDIDVNGRTVRVYNCHLESYSLSFTSLIKRLFHKESFTDEVVQVHERVHEATRRRSAQVDALLQREAESPYPNLVCGDFNDTPVSYTYHRLTKTKKDSFVEAGKGFSGTYSVLWPMLRIDYILLPQEYTADRHQTDRIPWSDHYPVTTYIYF